MGQHADMMAEINGITRSEQDDFAVRSHVKAAKAEKDGELAKEIVPIRLKDGSVIEKDEAIRSPVDEKKLRSLKPAFRAAEKGRNVGTVTAGTTSPTTDGAVAVLIMSEEKALELGFPTDISLLSSAFTALDPFPQTLLAPTLAIPKALDKAQLKLSDIDVFEIHEAFSAQILSTFKCLASPEYNQKVLNRDTPVGTPDPEHVNVNGGSLALGNPFAATGTRLVLTALRLLRDRNLTHALCSACAGGGMGGVLILKRS